LQGKAEQDKRQGFIVFAINWLLSCGDFIKKKNPEQVWVYNYFFYLQH